MVRLNPAHSLGVRWLFFRLRNGQSISPARLMSVWSEAAESNDCAVRREIIDGAGYVYALYAPNSLLSPRRVELRMRALLEEAGYAFAMGSLAGRHPGDG